MAEVNDWQKRPMLKALVKSVYPTYSRRKVDVVVADTITYWNLNWDDGSRREYETIELATGKAVASTDQYKHYHPGNNPGEGKTVRILDGFAVVEQSTSGKYTYVYVHANQADVDKLMGADKC